MLQLDMEFLGTLISHNYFVLLFFDILFCLIDIFCMLVRLPINYNVVSFSSLKILWIKI